MLVWCENDKLTIISDCEPKVAVRIILPTDSDFEKLCKKKRPFINKRSIKWTVNANDESYDITIPRQYCYDGASIPRAFWRVIGSKESDEFLIGAMVHDYMCENHDVIGNNRELSSEVFKQLLLACGVSKLKANIMYLAVNTFQKFCGWGK